MGQEPSDWQGPGYYCICEKRSFEAGCVNPYSSTKQCWYYSNETSFNIGLTCHDMLPNYIINTYISYSLDFDYTCEGSC